MIDYSEIKLIVVVGFYDDKGEQINLCNECEGKGEIVGECDFCDHQCERKCRRCNGMPMFYEIKSPEDASPNWADKPAGVNPAFCVIAKGRPAVRLAYENAFTAFKALEDIQDNPDMLRVFFTQRRSA